LLFFGYDRDPGFIGLLLLGGLSLLLRRGFFVVLTSSRLIVLRLSRPLRQKKARGSLSYSLSEIGKVEVTKKMLTSKLSIELPEGSSLSLRDVPSNIAQGFQAILSQLRAPRT
jgi:hypothetical protein